MFLLECTAEGTPYKIARETVDTGTDLYKAHLLSIDDFQYGVPSPQGGLASVSLGSFTVTKEAFGGSTVYNTLDVEIIAYSGGTTANLLELPAYRSAEDQDTITYTFWLGTTEHHPSDSLHIVDEFWVDHSGGAVTHYGAVNYLFAALGYSASDVELYEYSGLTSTTSVAASPVKMHVEDWEDVREVLNNLLLSRGCIAEIVDDELRVIDLFSGHVEEGEIDVTNDAVAWSIFRRAPISAVVINGRYPCQSDTDIELLSQTGQWTGLTKNGEVNVSTTHDMRSYGADVTIDIYDVTQDRDTFAENFRKLYNRDVYSVTVPADAGNIFPVGACVYLNGLSVYGIVTGYQISGETIIYTLIDGKRTKPASTVIPSETATWVDNITSITTAPTITEPQLNDYVRSSGSIRIEWDELDDDIMAVAYYSGLTSASDLQGVRCGNEVRTQDGSQVLQCDNVAWSKPVPTGGAPQYFIGIMIIYRRGASAKTSLYVRNNL